MNERKRIILVSELFFPDETSTAFIMSRISQYLSKNFNLLVLAGPESYEKDNSRLVTNENGFKDVQVERAWAPSLDKNNLLARTLRLAVLSFGLAWLVFVRTKRSDVVLTVSNPAPLIVLLALIRKLKKFSLLLLVHDVFPENSVAAGLLRKDSIFHKLIKLIFDWSYSAPDLIVTIGRDMAEVVADKTKGKKQRVRIIENWADLDLVKPIPRELSRIELWRLNENIVIQYAGNIGRAQGILELIDIISLAHNKIIHYVFLGSGALVNSLTQKIRGAGNITIGGAYSRDDQSIVLGSCDIALVILGRAMYGLGVPSKTYNIMAAGKPILYIGPKNSEIYRLVCEFNIG